VQALQERLPTVPVVLMTAVGSEEIALEALKKGAASYIPKRRLPGDLGPTLHQLLIAAESSRRMEQLLQCLDHLDSRFILPSNPDLIDPLASRLKGFLAELKFGPPNRHLHVYVALEEALRNALYHGNLEVNSDLRQEGDGRAYHDLIRHRSQEPPYCDRRLDVTIRLTPTEARFTVRDEGPGFDLARIPDPTDPANLERPSGRGLLLIQMFMDEVHFNERGNEITLVKRAVRPVAVPA
jgi:anti-sigma regulatory factor (Ser/Thr protein kinase)